MYYGRGVQSSLMGQSRERERLANEIETRFRTLLYSLPVTYNNYGVLKIAVSLPLSFSGAVEENVNAHRKRIRAPPTSQ